MLFNKAAAYGTASQLQVVKYQRGDQQNLYSSILKLFQENIYIFFSREIGKISMSSAHNTCNLYFCSLFVFFHSLQTYTELPAYAQKTDQVSILRFIHTTEETATKD